MIITLFGRIPSKKNSKQIVCRGRFPKVLPSKAYQEWHEEQSLLMGKWYKADGQTLPFQKVKGVEIRFMLPDQRKCDLTNKAESIMDLLVDNGILVDDCWQVTGPVNLIPLGVDHYNPRAEITIIP